MRSNDSLEQEVWITLRLKGTISAECDPDKASIGLLKRIEAYLLRCDRRGQSSFWRRLFKHRDRPLAFHIAHDGDVIDIEDESEIYETNDIFLTDR